jgi:gamma-glutamylcyclotransferase (GGCT)/AIG2-like uncharacterized protein YtfP
VLDHVLIAVYGTLKRGRENHAFFLAGAPFIGSGIIHGVAMINGLIPYAFSKAGAKIHVEVFSVDQQTVDRLDRLESVPYHYTRELRSVAMDDGRSVDAFVYLAANSTLKHVLKFDTQEIEVWPCV